MVECGIQKGTGSTKRDVCLCSFVAQYHRDGHQIKGLVEDSR